MATHPSKTKKVILAFHPLPQPHYDVVRIEHTTEFNPGDSLTKNAVEELNNSRHWNVAIVGAK